MRHIRRDVVYGRDGHALQGGHVEHVFGGHARVLHGRGVCGWLPDAPGFPEVRHQAEQLLVRQGHLDLQTESWQMLLFKSRDCARGREEHGEGLCADDEVLDLMTLAPVS